eukprot:GHVN01001617.1.p1 GENE.GHVN01001617.1~~GHVN01001617.1.p1  ORF type:complete len:493 (+),score=35.36 GHVN01001617.1:307-1785(+)
MPATDPQGGPEAHIFGRRSSDGSVEEGSSLELEETRSGQSGRWAKWCLLICCCMGGSTSNKMELALRRWFTLYCHFLPIVGEAVFNYRNYERFVVGRRWFVLPDRINPVDRPVYLLVADEVPGPILDGNGLYVIDFDPSDYSECTFLQGFSNGTRSWVVDPPTSQTPERVVVVFLLLFTMMRWIFIGGRGTLLSFGCIRVNRWSVHVFFCFLYLASTVFCVGMIGIELSDCVEWWAVGRSPLQLLMWQLGYWVMNCGGLGVLGVTMITRKFGLLGCHEVYTDSCFGDPLYFLVAVFFVGSAFLGAAPVLILGLLKPWILSIWIGLLFITLDVLVQANFRPFPHVQHRGGVDNAERRRRMLLRARTVDGRREMAPFPSVASPTRHLSHLLQHIEARVGIGLPQDNTSLPSDGENSEEAGGKIFFHPANSMLYYPQSEIDARQDISPEYNTTNNPSPEQLGSGCSVAGPSQNKQHLSPHSPTKKRRLNKFLFQP